MNLKLLSTKRCSFCQDFSVLVGRTNWLLMQKSRRERNDRLSRMWYHSNEQFFYCWAKDQALLYDLFMVGVLYETRQRQQRGFFVPDVRGLFILKIIQQLLNHLIARTPRKAIYNCLQIRPNNVHDQPRSYVSSDCSRKVTIPSMSKFFAINLDRHIIKIPQNANPPHTLAWLMFPTKIKM